MQLQVPIPITNSLISKKSFSLTVSQMFSLHFLHTWKVIALKKILKKCSENYLTYSHTNYVNKGSMGGERMRLLARPKPLKNHLRIVFQSRTALCNPKLVLFYYLKNSWIQPAHFIWLENIRKKEYQTYTVLYNQRVTQIHLQLSGESCMTLKLKTF